MLIEWKKIKKLYDNHKHISPHFRSQISTTVENLIAVALVPRDTEGDLLEHSCIPTPLDSRLFQDSVKLRKPWNLLIDLRALVVRYFYRL